MSEPAEPQPEPQPEELIELLTDVGVSRAEIDAAIQDEYLELLAIDVLVAGGLPKYTLDDLAERGDIDMDLRKRMWRAVGMADPEPDVVTFTESDVDMALSVQTMLDPQTITGIRLIQIARVLGSSMARIAESQVGAVEAAREHRKAELAAGREDPGRPLDLETILDLSITMDYVWKLHLRAAARRRIALKETGITDELSVGFVDLVDFTRLSESLSDAELVELVDAFEGRVFDTVAEYEGQVIKTIGDAVMYVIRDTPKAAQIALELVEIFAQDRDRPDVRVGIATGPVVEKEGDLFGPTVNLASRLTGLAYPAAVLVSEVTAKELATYDGFILRELPAQRIKGIGRRKPSRIRWASDEDPETPKQIERHRLRKRLLI